MQDYAEVLYAHDQPRATSLQVLIFRTEELPRRAERSPHVPLVPMLLGVAYMTLHLARPPRCSSSTRSRGGFLAARAVLAEHPARAPRAAAVATS